MKRIIALLLCISCMLAGCIKNQNSDQVEKDPRIEQEDPVVEQKDPIIDEENPSLSEDKSSPQLLTLSTDWSLVTSYDNGGKSKYHAPAYQSKVPSYRIAKDLSNIENIGQFSGFTNQQVQMLVKNGFVVMPSQDTRMYYVYESNEYQGVPNFITTDTVLHLYHQFYDKSLLFIETEFLYDDLELMTKQMLDKSIQVYEALKEEDLRKLQEKNIVYFMIARMLMLQSSEIDIGVLEELLQLAQEEYALIEKAEGYQKSPFLQIDYDYSQFTVRGHYTKSEELARFFRTMIWFGTAPISLLEEDNMDYENTLQALLISFTTFLDSKEVCDAQLWSNIYEPTGQYVGQSDDMNVFTLNGLRLSVYGNVNNPNVFNDKEYFDSLTQQVKALPKPKIQADLVALDAPTGLQFRFMGQRYILDSYILQNLTDSRQRPIPSALDVMGVMGNALAEEYLYDVYRPQDTWPKYEERYHKLKEEVAGYQTEIWSSNLYNGWLWCIKEAMTEYDSSSGMPFFMTNKSWANKSLNAALGSYTELKHDTVLYGKQSVAESGDFYEVAESHYVEPNIDLYHKLYYLTDLTITILKDREMLNDSFLDAAENYKSLLKLLIDCSIKELNNEPLTENEIKSLLYYGGELESITLSLLMGLTGDYATKETSDMLVSDVATYMGSYLSLGTGYFDHIYVVVPMDGKLYLSRGSVYSHYEFVSDTRLTDEQWWELNGIKVRHEEYGDYPEFVEPSKDLPKQPFWIETFKTDTNEVDIKALDIDWDDFN